MKFLSLIIIKDQNGSCALLLGHPVYTKRKVISFGLIFIAVLKFWFCNQILVQRHLFITPKWWHLKILALRTMDVTGILIELLDYINYTYKRGWKQFHDDFTYIVKDKKEEMWLSPMTKAPTPTEQSKCQHKSDNKNNATKKFDKTAIADRLRTASWSNNSHPTDMVNRFTGLSSHSPQQSCNQNDMFVNQDDDNWTRIQNILWLFFKSLKSDDVIDWNRYFWVERNVQVIV